MKVACTVWSGGKIGDEIKTILSVRRKGQGKKGFKIPVLFPINLGHILVIV